MAQHLPTWAATSLANAAAAGSFVHGLAVIKTVAAVVGGAAAGFVGGAILSGNLKGAVKGAFYGGVTAGFSAGLMQTGLSDAVSRGLSGGINGALETGDSEGFMRGYFAAQLTADMGIERLTGKRLYYTNKYANFVTNRIREYTRGFIIDGKEGARKNLKYGAGLEAFGHAFGVVGSSIANKRFVSPSFREGVYYYPANYFTAASSVAAVTFGNVVIGDDDLFKGNIGTNDLDMLDRHERAHFFNQSNLGPYYLPAHIASQWGSMIFGYPAFLEYGPFQMPGYECFGGSSRSGGCQ